MPASDEVPEITTKLGLNEFKFAGHQGGNVTSITNPPSHSFDSNKHALMTPVTHSSESMFNAMAETC